MERKTSADFDPELLVLFDAYVHGAIDRRGFLDKAKRFAVGGVTAAMLLDQLNPKFAEAQVVTPDDKRIKGEDVDYPSPQGSGTMKGYLVRPAAAKGKLPAIVVIHENRGLNPHIRDVARRIALDNYLAFAPDALAPLGGYPGSEDEARTLFGKLDRSKQVDDFIAAVQFVQKHAESSGRTGCVGFCWGGQMSHTLATRLPDLRAAVPFYGPAPSPDEAAKVKAALLFHMAENDARVNQTWPPYEAALKAANVRFEVYTYPGTNHGFNNDTTPRYDEAAAKLAWQRTMDWFAKHVRG